MNLSAAIPGSKPYHILYLDYTDWSAVVESRFGVISSYDGKRRGDGQRVGRNTNGLTPVTTGV
jgi:hypothetical protein